MVTKINEQDKETKPKEEVPEEKSTSQKKRIEVKNSVREFRNRQVKQNEKILQQNKENSE